MANHLAQQFEPVMVLDYKFRNQTSSDGPATLSLYFQQTQTINHNAQAWNAHRSNSEAKTVPNDTKLKWPLPLETKLTTHRIQRNNMNTLWAGSAIPMVLIDEQPSKLPFLNQDDEQKAMMLADVIAVHDSAFQKFFTDKYLAPLA